MDPIELVKLIETLNPQNKAGRITIITRMGAENTRVMLPHLIRAVRGSDQVVTWVTDPMHGNTLQSSEHFGLMVRIFNAIRVSVCFAHQFNPFFFPMFAVHNDSSSNKNNHQLTYDYIMLWWII